MTGMIFDIQRFSIHDGPGIRTTVFMKGCSLRCRWCHNPEGMSMTKQIQYMDNKCIGCKKCESVCSYGVHSFKGKKHEVQWDKCKLCRECMNICPAKALSTCGRTIQVEALLKLILEDKIFYGKEGGVTFSGGEAFMQWNFVTEVLKECKERGIHTAIDTSGYCKWECIEETLPYCDLYLYDVKCLDIKKHREMTGVDPTIIIENLRKLNQEKKSIWIRVPVIKGLNDSTEEISAIARLVSSLDQVKQTTLMPYHVLGKEKYITLGLIYPYDASQRITEEELEGYKEIFRQEKISLK